MNRQTKNVLCAVLATGIMAFSGVLIETAMNVTFPSLMEEFGITTHAVQWVTTIYLLMIAITVPISGYLIKNFSAKKLFITANLLFLAGVILNYLALNFVMLLGGRLLQGVATGIALPLMFHIILSEAPLKQRGLMMGLGTFATSIAPAIGPTYGGFLTTKLTWHYIYFFLIPLLLISLVLGLKTFIHVAPKKSGGFDVANFLLLAGFFISFLCGLSFLTSWHGPALLVLAVIFFGAFYTHNKKITQPLLNFELLKNGTFTRLLLLFLVYQFVLLGISFVIPNFIQIVLGKTSATAGLAMLPGAAIGALFSPLSGRLLDRIGPQRPLLFGCVVALAGLISLSISLYFSLGIPWLIFSHVLFQIGTGFSYSNSITTAMNHLQKNQANDGNSLFNTLQQFTGAVATAVVAATIGFFQQHNADFLTGTRLGAFTSGLLLAVLMFLGVISLLSVYKKIGASR